MGKEDVEGEGVGGEVCAKLGRRSGGSDLRFSRWVWFRISRCPFSRSTIAVACRMSSRVFASMRSVSSTEFIVYGIDAGVGAHLVAHATDIVTDTIQDSGD